MCEQSVRFRRVAFLVAQTACLLVCISVGSLDAKANEVDDPLHGFESYVRTALADWKTPGIAVAVIRRNETLLLNGYGVREMGKPESVDKDTVFPISSVTKAFTATGLALLVEDERLAWDDRVIQHLPEFQLRDAYLTKEVRLADLLAHRTGLERADILAYRGDYDRTELIRRLRYLQPVSPFRHRFGYHNLMIVTAGEILQKVSGKTWAEFMREKIFRPLKMNSSHTEFNPKITNASTVHVLVNGKPIVDPLKDQRRIGKGFRRLHKAVAPAGSIQSSISDLGKFLQMYVNEGVFEERAFLRPQTVRKMAAPHSVLPIKTSAKPNFAYPRFFYGGGLGWQMRDYRGRKIVYHTGSSGAVVAFMPEEKIGVAVLANRGCGIPFMVMHDVFDRLLGIPRDVTNEDWLNDGMKTPEQSRAARNAELESQRAKETIPSLALSQYVGVYKSDLYGQLRIQLRKKELHLQFGPNIEATLRHWENDTFRGQLNFPPPGDWLLKFVIKKGEAERVEIERIFWHEAMPAFVRVE